MTLWKETPHCISPPCQNNHRHCANGYKIILVFHVILYDHVIKWSCDFMGKSLKVSHHTAMFCGHKHSDRGGMSLVCHAISKNHFIIQPLYFKGKRQSR